MSSLENSIASIGELSSPINTQFGNFYGGSWFFKKKNNTWAGVKIRRVKNATVCLEDLSTEKRVGILICPHLEPTPGETYQYIWAKWVVDISGKQVYLGNSYKGSSYKQSMPELKEWLYKTCIAIKHDKTCPNPRGLQAAIDLF